MSTDRIKELLDLMQDHELGELEMREGDFEVRLVKQAAICSAQVPMAVPSMPMAASAAPVAQGGGAEAAAVAGPDKSDLTPINSPIVGTFYSAPSPDSDPFVKVGDSVNSETIVCIVEAMKVMNEVKAELSGTIAEVLVQNGEAVEYGQPIFLVKQ